MVQTALSCDPNDGDGTVKLLDYTPCGDKEGDHGDTFLVLTLLGTCIVCVGILFLMVWCERARNKQYIEKLDAENKLERTRRIRDEEAKKWRGDYESSDEESDIESQIEGHLSGGGLSSFGIPSSGLGFMKQGMCEDPLRSKESTPTTPNKRVPSPSLSGSSRTSVRFNKDDEDLDYGRTRSSSWWGRTGTRRSKEIDEEALIPQTKLSRPPEILPVFPPDIGNRRA